MNTTSAVSTTYEPEDLPPISVDFLRAQPGEAAPDAAAFFAEIAKHDPEGIPQLRLDASEERTFSGALAKLLVHENALFAWMEKSDANRRFFAKDPEAALRAAVPDLDPALFDELRRFAPRTTARSARGRSESRTPIPLFAGPIVTATEAMPFHVATATQMNGWDMIVATRQGIINTGIKKLYEPQIIDTTVNAGDFLGDVKIYLKIGTPSVDTVQGGGRLGRVTIPLVEGHLQARDRKIDCGGATVSITSNLIAVEAKIQPKSGDGKNYDVFVDVKSREAVYDVRLRDTSEPDAEAFIAAALKSYLKTAAGHTYKLATVNLGKLVPDAASSLIPRVADFTFVHDAANPDDTTFAALVLNDEKKKRGDFFFNASMMPANAKVSALISNEIFMRQLVMPALAGALKDQTRDGKEPTLSAKLNGDGSWHLTNPGHIDIKHDRNPWIEAGTLDCFIGDGLLRMNVEVRAQVGAIVAKIRASVAWRIAVKVDENGKQTIELEKAEYREEKNVSMEWWGWLLAALFSIIGLIVAAIVMLIVYLNVPSLKENLFIVPMKAVEWPAQKEIRLDAVTLPSPVQITATPTFIV